MKSWALVPARGGSKSIPLKNLLRLSSRPLLDYVVRAGQASAVLERIICSTDNERIAERANTLGIEVDWRPATLATDDAKVDDVARDLLMRQARSGARSPDVIVLLQPTSPFLQPEQIRQLLAFFGSRPSAASAHTVYAVPHNLHIWNQRQVTESAEVTFPFESERERARNKQQKPKTFAFGNLIATRAAALLSGAGFYAKPSVALPIDAKYAFDLDQQADIAMAEAMIAARLINLDHLEVMPSDPADPAARPRPAQQQRS